MKKNQREQERARSAYVPPRVEVHGAAPSRLMGTSFIGEHSGGNNMADDRSEHERGIDGGVQYGAKTVILGQQFSFNDVWEE